MKKRDYKTSERFFEAVHALMPQAEVMGHVGPDRSGGELYFVYVPPDADSLREDLTRRFGELNVPNLIEEIVSKIHPEELSSQTTDRSDLVSRVRERLLFEFLGEIEAEFLWPLYQVAERLLDEIESTSDPVRLIRLLDMTQPLLGEVWDYSKFDHQNSKVHVTRHLRGGVLTKEVLSKRGRRQNRGRFFMELRQAKQRVRSQNLDPTLENIAAALDLVPRSLSKQCKQYAPAPDRKHFKRAMELCGD